MGIREELGEGAIGKYDRFLFTCKSYLWLANFSMYGGYRVWNV